ncbi:hypothetical protein SAMN04488123_103304 [Natribacillus halophilus]|uniref:Uncharacterized protein n=1 Tax=Natribacillus halophilus TaxID=549003 RepID=A0A1G8LVW3_9BACI|nr:hypothetical protein SAMN04488123_103304 [Natribacillus halophilus]
MVLYSVEIDESGDENHECTESIKCYGQIHWMIGENCPNRTLIRTKRRG